jgi:hypothetical protein
VEPAFAAVGPKQKGPSSYLDNGPGSFILSALPSSSRFVLLNDQIDLANDDDRKSRDRWRRG